MSATMTLRIVTPVGIAFEAAVARIVAAAPGGSFGLLPRHVDFVSGLVPGVLVIETDAGEERFVGIDEGTLVKCGRTVTVATRDAIVGDDLATLEGQVAEAFLTLDEHERVARSALARLEAGIVRRFVELRKGGLP